MSAENPAPPPPWRPTEPVHTNTADGLPSCPRTRSVYFGRGDFTAACVGQWIALAS